MANMYTKQQLTGGQVYDPKTRIGNWNEDVEQDEGRFSDYLDLKQRNGLISMQIANNKQRMLQSVPLSFREPGEPLQYGDAVMLRSEATAEFFALDPAGKDSWDVSTVEESRPVARNVFFITRAPEDGTGAIGGEPGELHFDEPFCLASEPALRVGKNGMVLSPYWAFSEPKTYEIMSRFATQAPVKMAKRCTQNCVFKVVSSLPGEKGWQQTVRRGPVIAGADLAISHRLTRCNLSASSKFSFKGKVTGRKEHEVYGSVPEKSSVPVEQKWQFVVADSPEEAADERGLAPLDVATIVEDMRANLGDSADDVAFAFSPEEIGTKTRASFADVWAVFAALDVPFAGIEPEMLEVVLSTIAHFGDQTIAVADLNAMMGAGGGGAQG